MLAAEAKAGTLTARLRHGILINPLGGLWWRNYLSD